MTEVNASRDPAAASQDQTPMARDQPHMARALNLAARGLYTTDPNPRVGCVVVRDDRVLGEGWHVRAGEAHAEVLALRAAGPDARGVGAGRCTSRWSRAVIRDERLPAQTP